MDALHNDDDRARALGEIATWSAGWPRFEAIVSGQEAKVVTLPRARA
jgi:hypothetical protein